MLYVSRMCNVVDRYSSGYRLAVVDSVGKSDQSHGRTPEHGRGPVHSSPSSEISAQAILTQRSPPQIGIFNALTCASRLNLE